MEKKLGLDIGLDIKTAMVFIAAALALAWGVLTLASPVPALADTVDVAASDGIIISLDGAASEVDGTLVYEVSSYRDAASGEVVNLDDPFTVTFADAAE